MRRWAIHTNAQKKIKNAAEKRKVNTRKRLTKTQEGAILKKETRM